MTEEKDKNRSQMRVETVCVEDIDFVKSALGGDKESFEKLVDRYHRWIYSFIKLAVTDPHIVEDITQEVFLRAYRSLKTCRDIKKFRTWLFSIARNCIREWLRTKKGVQMHSHIDLDKLENNPSLVQNEVDQHVKKLEVLEQAVSTLPDETKQVLLMKYKENKTCAEIARILDKETNTVAKLLSRSYDKLKKVIDGGTEQK